MNIQGGETIRQINQASGAHVELNRNIPENGPKRLFTIRGSFLFPGYRIVRGLRIESCKLTVSSRHRTTNSTGTEYDS